MLPVTEAGGVGKSLGEEEVMEERTETSLEGRLTDGRVEGLLEDGASFGAEGALTVGARPPLEVEVAEVSSGAGALWEDEDVGTSLGKTGATEEIAGAPWGDRAVEISLEVSVAGAFLGAGTMGALSGDVGAGVLLGGLGERGATAGAVEAPPGDRAAGAFGGEGAIFGREVLATSREGLAGPSLGAEFLSAFLDDGVLGLFEGEGGITAGAVPGDGAAGASLRATGIGAFL